MAIDTIKSTAILDGAVTSADLDTNLDIAGTLDVTGKLTADSNLLVGSGSAVGNANANELELTNPAGSGTVGMTLNVNSGSADTGNIYWRSNSSNNNIQIVGDPVSNYLAFSTSGTEKLRIDSDGYVTKPSTPSFAAYINGGSINFSTLSDGDIVVFNSTMFNNGSHYDTSNGKFTAPVSGKYYMEVWLRIDQLGTVASDYYHGMFKINGSGNIGGYTTRVITTAHTLNIFNFVTSGIIMDLSANDQVFWSHGDGNASSTNAGSAYYQTGQCRFQGFLLH